MKREEIEEKERKEKGEKSGRILAHAMSNMFTCCASITFNDDLSHRFQSIKCNTAVNRTARKMPFAPLIRIHLQIAAGEPAFTLNHASLIKNEHCS